MTTLHDLKKQQGLTNVEIGRALECSPTKAGMILQGRYIHVYHDEEIAQLADLLGVTFERCWFAMQESYNEFMKIPGMEHQRPDEIRAEVQTQMQEKWPSLGVKVDKPRERATIESVLIVPEERRLS